MYQEYFGLRELPFTLTPDTYFFLNSETHEQALEMLRVALQNREGFLKVTGEVGTGKTLICRKLLNELGDDFITAYIPNPNVSAETLYCLLAEELGASSDLFDACLAPEGTTDRQVLALREINEYLLNFADDGYQVVLVIDEAQSMPRDTLEALRLLTNLETESDKLLQVVLFGQPELDEMLNSRDLRQLLQRITFSYRLNPFTRADIERYIAHRMILSGYQGGPLFEAKAVSLLVKASRGIPRLVNVLCHKALMLCYGQGDSMVRGKHMHAAIRDTDSVRGPGLFGWRGWREAFFS